MQTTDIETDTYPYERRCPFSMPDGYRHGPPTKVPLASGGSAWLLTEYEHVRLALRSLSNDRLDPAYPSPIPLPTEMKSGGSMLALDGPAHAAIRRIVQPEFTKEAAQRLEPMIQREVELAVDDMLAAGPPADLHAAVGVRVTMEVIAAMLGKTLDDQAFLDERKQIMFGQGSTIEERRKAVTELDEHFEDLIRTKLDNPEDDVTSRVAERWPEPKDLREIANLIRLLMNGGHESSSSMVSLGMLALLQHPEQLEVLRERPESIDSAVEELLRFITVTDLTTPRVAKEDIEIGGVQIRAGEGVIASTGAANRDPSIFVRPDTLDVTRTDNEHVTFGFGAHRCIGLEISRIELRHAYRILIERVPTLRLAVPFEDLHFRSRGLIFRLDTLPVTW